jgi:uncharacterized membrane protein (DUF373 family)
VTKSDLAKTFEQVIVVALMVMMGLVVFLATVELAWILVQDIINPPLLLLEIHELLELFGLFMLILIGVELFETVQTYHLQRIIRVEVVISVAVIAICRKVIILDYKSLTSFTLFETGAVIMALGGAYYLIKKTESRPSDRPPEDEGVTALDKTEPQA